MIPPLTAPVVGLKLLVPAPGTFPIPLGDWAVDAPRPPDGCETVLPRAPWLEPGPRPDPIPDPVPSRPRPRPRSPSGTLTWDGGLCSDPDHVEIFLSDRIEVFLAKEPALDQDVDARRERVRVLCAVQGYRTRVLLAAEDQLRFLLALGSVAPRRERDAHEDGHHGEADKQRRHGVAPFSTFKIRESLTL